MCDGSLICYSYVGHALFMSLGHLSKITLSFRGMPENAYCRFEYLDLDLSTSGLKKKHPFVGGFSSMVFPLGENVHTVGSRGTAWGIIVSG